MGLKKILLMIILTIIFPPFGLILIIYLDVMIGLFILGLLLKPPLWVLKKLGKGTQKINLFFHHGAAEVRDHKTKYGILGLIIFLILHWFFPVIGTLMENDVGDAVVVMAPFLFIWSITVVSIAALSSSRKRRKGTQTRSQEDLPGSKSSLMKAGTAAAALTAADEAAGVYKNVKTGAAAAEGGGLAESMGAAILEKFGMENAAAELAGAGGITAALPYILIALVIILVLFFLQFILFWGWMITLAGGVLGAALKPFMAILGLGSEYANYLGQTVGNQYIAGVDISDELRVYNQARARIFCLLKGPACLRQWRLNNTQRPGSEDVGETYGLKIDRFDVGQGEKLDVAYKDSDYTIPVSFTLSNPRHGLKGINAYDVSFRIKVIDMNNDESDPYCDTGWIEDIKGYNIRDDSSPNDIYPGTSASTGFMEITSGGSGDTVEADKDGLTLEECEMLQPALGEFRTAILKVRYDYFSQATLYFDAMSRETLQSDSSISKTWKESKTADTPVKAAINVNSPVIFTETSSGRESQPFAVRATLNTDKTDVEYQIQEFKIRNSRFTTNEPGASCQFREPDEPPLEPGETVELNEEAKANFISGFDGEREPSYYRFTSDRGPPIAGCVMKLADGEQSGIKNKISGLSETGETLNMGVEASYTVSKRFRLGSLEVYRSQCSQINCPVLISLQENQSRENYNFKAECSGVDAGNGCFVTDKTISEWGTFEKPSKNAEGDDPTDNQIESGEYVVNLKDLDVEGDNSDSIKRGPEGIQSPTGTGYAGLDSSNWEEIDENTNGEIDENSNGFAIVQHFDRDGEREVTLEMHNERCDGPVEWKENSARYSEDDRLIAYKQDNAACAEDDGGGGLLDWLLP